MGKTRSNDVIYQEVKEIVSDNEIVDVPKPFINYDISTQIDINLTFKENGVYFFSFYNLEDNDKVVSVFCNFYGKLIVSLDYDNRGTGSILDGYSNSGTPTSLNTSFYIKMPIGSRVKFSVLVDDKYVYVYKGYAGEM